MLHALMSRWVLRVRDRDPQLRPEEEALKLVEEREGLSFAVWRLAQCHSGEPALLP
jgi:hypothetical protein